MCCDAPWKVMDAAAAEGDARTNQAARHAALTAEEAHVSLGRWWERQLRAGAGAAAGTSAASTPAAPGLLDTLHEGKDDELTVFLEQAVRHGRLGARELLVLEAVNKRFSRARMEAVAETLVKEFETAHLGVTEWNKCGGGRAGEARAVCAAVPRMPAEAELCAGCTYEEWAAAREPERRAVGRLIRSGSLWAELTEGKERWLDKLARVLAYRAPPAFTNLPPCCAVSAADTLGNLGPAGTVVTMRQNVGVACSPICGHGTQRMRAGVHYVNFHIVRADLEATDSWPRVGIVQADHDAAEMWSASDTEHGWGWDPSGTVWHDCAVWGEGLGDEYRWGAGATLGLRLDMGTGVLAGRVNGGPLTALACGLHEHDLGMDAQDRALTRELCWCVDIEGEGCEIRVAAGAPATPALAALPVVRPLTCLVFHRAHRKASRGRG